LRYEVIRVWQLPVEQLLSGGVGTLALAPICNVPESELRGVIQRMKERLGGPTRPQRADDVWAAAYVLSGLRYSDAFVQPLFKEVLSMEQSVTYQAILRRGREEGRVEGRMEEARHFFLVLGEQKLGPAGATVRAALERIDDPARFEELGARLLSATTWEEVLPPPAPPRRRGRRR
jgi:predicted transposase YdaD